MNIPTTVTSPSDNGAVCILGMHRSGTSMVAGLLSTCGLWLGPQDRLMPPHPDNPDGYFENLDLVTVNEALLRQLNGSWDTPPNLPDGWVSDRAVERLAAEARAQLRHIEQTAAGRLWGWKDPRTCITLPFWQQLVPGLKVIVCLRNPIAVARSLHRRNKFSLCQGLDLWQTYNQRIMEQFAPDNFIVTHYDAWFNNPENELRRLLDFLNWEVTEDKQKDAVRAIRIEHRRHESGSLTSLAALGGPGPYHIYSELRALAGPYYSGKPEEAPTPDDHSSFDKFEWMALAGKAEQASRLEQLLTEERRKNTELRLEQKSLLSKHSFYRLGDVIDFSRGGNAPLYIRQGWSNPGIRATRISGDRARLTLRLIDPINRELRISAKLRLVQLPEQPLSIEVLANDQTIADWTLSQVNMKRFEATIPAECDRPKLQLEFRLPKAVPRTQADHEVRQGILIREITISEM